MIANTSPTGRQGSVGALSFTEIVHKFLPDMFRKCFMCISMTFTSLFFEGLTTEVRRACRSGPMPLLGSCTTSFPKGSSGDAHNIVEATSCNYYCNESINCNTSPTISKHKVYHA